MSLYIINTNVLLLILKVNKTFWILIINNVNINYNYMIFIYVTYIYVYIYINY